MSQRVDLPIVGSGGERPRKKPRTVRRSTRSCAECKRRKIRCELSTDFSLTVCSTCTQRGIPCVTQESQNVKSPNNTKTDERLARVETLLERLVEKEKSQESDDRQESTSPEDGGRELLPQLSSNAAYVHESGPLLSLFDNSVASRREVSDPSHSPGYKNEISPGKIPAISGSSRLGKTRQALSALLPSQRDADIIAEHTNGWILFHVLCTASSDNPISTSNLDGVAEQEPTIIARTLLYIAVCIQQLPPDFDSSSLQMCRQTSILDIAENYTATVASLVTTNDILSTTMPGLECLLLQSLFHLNAGHLQRSWITTRRALTVAQLLNLHSEFLKPLTAETDMTQMANRTMWQKVVQADRSLCVIMGLPCGTGNDCFGDDEEMFTEFNKDQGDIFERKMCLIAGALTKRNQIQDTKTYDATQRIDERMDRIAAHMSHAWWVIPELPMGDSKGSGQFDRLLVQMWFFQMKSFLHLPFLLREDHKNEYSRLSCVDASREIVFRYLALRKVQSTQLMCKLIDFGAFIACVILILDQIRSQSIGKEAHEVSPEKKKDAELIQEIIRSMEMIAHSEREVVVRESVIVMKALLDTNTSSKKLRLTIPYIGTISVLREHPTEHAPTPRDCSISSIIEHQNLHPTMTEPSPGGQSWQNPEGFSPTPFLSFDPSFEEDQMIVQGWEPEPLEEIFFYSMMGSDVGGEWIF